MSATLYNLETTAAEQQVLRLLLVCLPLLRPQVVRETHPVHSFSPESLYILFLGLLYDAFAPALLHQKSYTATSIQ